jgi:hypothetical protein
VTASDIAYTILVYENTKEVWEEDLQIKTSSRADDERCNAMHHKKNKYHVGRGKRLKRFGDGWTNNGQEYTKNCSGSSRNSSQVKYGIHLRSLEIVSKEALCQR